MQSMYALQCGYATQVIPYIFLIVNILKKNQTGLNFYQPFPTQQFVEWRLQHVRLTVWVIQTGDKF